jgi:hypothetical protein
MSSVSGFFLPQTRQMVRKGTPLFPLGIHLWPQTSQKKNRPPDFGLFIGRHPFGSALNRFASLAFAEGFIARSQGNDFTHRIAFEAFLNELAALFVSHGDVWQSKHNYLPAS